MHHYIPTFHNSPIYSISVLHNIVCSYYNIYKSNYTHKCIIYELIRYKTKKKQNNNILHKLIADMAEKFE